LLDRTQTQAKPLEFDPLDQIRAQFADQFTSSQRLSRAAEVLEQIIQLVIQRVGLKAQAYIFLDGLDEAYRAGDIVVAVESLAEHLRSTSLVVTSRESSVVDRLRSRTAFDTFSLGALTEAEAAQLIRRLFADTFLAEPAIEQLVAKAEGNPLLLNLFASYFRERGDLGTLKKSDTIRIVLDRLYHQVVGSDQTGKDARLLLIICRAAGSDQRKVLIQRQKITYIASSGGLAPRFWPRIRCSKKLMPRANRHFLPDHVWHITHRCHQKKFLLKFARDRQRYLRWVFEAKKRFGLSVLDYMRRVLGSGMSNSLISCLGRLGEPFIHFFLVGEQFTATKDFECCQTCLSLLTPLQPPGLAHFFFTQRAGEYDCIPRLH
jgi:hypothetical protein